MRWQGQTAVGLRLLLLVVMTAYTCEAAMSLPLYWWSRGVGGNGAFFSPSINPCTPDNLFVSTDMGVGFRSDNNGAWWNVYSFTNLTGGRLLKMQYTADPRVLYVLDGSAVIKRSTDGGQAWSSVTNDPAAAYGATRKKLRSDAGHAGRLVLGQDYGLWFSGNGATNWVKFYTNPAPGTLTCYLADTFFCGSNIFVAGNFGLYVSTNHGTNFFDVTLSGIDASEDIVSFAGASANGHIRLYCITADSATVATMDDGYPSPPEAIYAAPAAYKGVYACDWPGGSWVMLTNGIRSVDTPAFVACATNRPDLVYLAGQGNDWGWPAAYRSANAGTNWVSIFTCTLNQNIQTGLDGDHGDENWGFGGGALGFDVCASDPGRLLFNNMGYLYGSTNGGTLWQALYLPPAERHPAGATTPTHCAYHGIGLEDTTCWWLTWLNTNTLFASFTDCGALRSTNNGAAWIAAGADVGYNTIYCCVTDGTGRAYAAASSVHDMYVNSLQDSRIDKGSGAILVTTNNAVSWQVLHNFNMPVIWLAWHPTNNNLLYASVINSTNGGIYVTSNRLSGAASTWSRCASPPRTQGHPLSITVLRDGTLVCSYSARQNSSGVFTFSSGVFVSTNSGAGWTDVSFTNMQCWTKDLVVYPFDSSQRIWFACVCEDWGGAGRLYNAGGLYRTTNRGQSWTSFAWGASYPMLHEVTSISFHPADTNVALISTADQGLLVCTNILAASPSFVAVTNYPFFQPTRIFVNPGDTNEIWATSFGNGLRVGWLSEPAPQINRLTISNGTALLAGGARDGQRFTVQTSTNLMAWSDLATNTGVNLCFTNADAYAGSCSSRFYRVQLARPIAGP